MIFDPYKILMLGVGYLTLLFGIAWLTDKGTERGWIPRHWVEHPIVYVLSIGVFACSWAFYGAIDLANEYGYGALAYYMGIGGLFIFAPLLLSPLFRLIRLYQIGSLADLLVFRFRGRRVGAATTICMLLAIMPLMALQIQAVADTVQILTQAPVSGDLNSARSNSTIALVFCLGIAIFAAMFGVARDHHRGLVTALAFESIVKLVALLSVGAFAVFGVFGSLPQLQWWLVLHPENLQVLHTPIRQTSSHTLLLLFFSTAIAMPHAFHMGFRENNKLSNIRVASWGIPLYLLILSLPIYPILWAGFELGTDLAPEYFTLGVPLAAGNVPLTLLAYLGGLSAATGAMIVITLALTTMCLNHLILPVFKPVQSGDFYGLLLWLRRSIMVGLILCAYLLYYALDDRQGLSNLAMVAFVETMQFLPGILAVLYWPQANRNGLLSGLAVGSTIWFFCLLLPMLVDTFRVLELPSLGIAVNIGMSYWSIIGIAALCLNGIVFIVVSLLTERTEQEINSADICSIDSLNRPMRRELSVTSVQEVQEQLGAALGEKTAMTEVSRALSELELPEDEARPYALRRLRDKLEANLSGLMGSALAHELIDRVLPYQGADAPVTEDIHFAETQLNEYRHHLTGLAAELDSLRRYHRQILEDLPMAVCSIGNDQEVVMWNHALESLTHIAAHDVLGSKLSGLPQPWRQLLQDFFSGDRQHSYKQHITLDGKPHWINLHKADIAHRLTDQQDGQVILLEDLTETHRLEEELIHSERLASVGRLAAGVAHEIGNPVTGIACLAQNLEEDTDDQETLETAKQILGQTERISNIVSTLVNFSHSGQTQNREDADTVQVINLHHCTEEAIHLLKLDKSSRPVEFINKLPGSIKVIGNDQRLTQVMINLLSNARDASEEHGRVWIEFEDRDESIAIKVSDEGSGISAENLPHLFEPFYTTKEAGAGTGLGLALVYNIVEEHYGTISADSPAHPAGGSSDGIAFRGPGTCFTIVLSKSVG